MSYGPKPCDRYWERKPIIGYVYTKKNYFGPGTGKDKYPVVATFKAATDGKTGYVTNLTIENKCLPLYISGQAVRKFVKRKGKKRQKGR